MPYTPYPLQKAMENHHLYSKNGKSTISYYFYVPVGCGTCLVVLRKYQKIKHQGLFRQAPNGKVPLPSDAATHVQIQTLLKCLESMDLRCRLFTLSPLSC